MMLEQRPRGWESASLLKVWGSVLQAVGEAGVEEGLPTETAEAPPCPVAEPMVAPVQDFGFLLFSLSFHTGECLKSSELCVIEHRSISRQLGINVGRTKNLIGPFA